MNKANLIGILYLILIFSCNNDSQQLTLKNKVQERFDNFLKRTKEKEYFQPNEIQKREFLENFEDTLSRFVDSTKVFVNWSGTIKDIKTRDIDTATVISCIIFYKPEEYREVSFHCSHVVRTADMKNDSLYQKLKDIPNYSIVYFDGFIPRNIENKIIYNYGSDDLKISYPHYEFNLLDISTQFRSDTLPKSLQYVVNIDFKVVELLKEKVQKKISDAEWQKQTKALDLDNLENKLTPAEKRYSTRLKQYLFSDFLYR